MAIEDFSLKEIGYFVPEIFFLENTVEVAQKLLGKILIVYDEAGNLLGGRIAETEAYLSTNDAASHSYCGITKRNSAMFAIGGTVYVYRSYGVHFCMNIVTEQENIGAAVLIRSIIPMFGLDIMKRNRMKDDLRVLCNGPGKLTQALGISLFDNFKKINNSNIHILDDGCKLDFITTKRIGITKSADLPLRFVII
jgi:DNA-3-methyladenine glycosylase